MPIKLNLLPQSATVSTGLGKTLKQVKTVGIVLLGLFLFFVLGVSGYLVYGSINLSNLTNEEDSIKSRIKSQETVEQRMVLLKDRIAKINKARTSPSVQKNLSSVNSLITALPEGVVLTELNLDQKKTDLSLMFGTSNSLSSFLELVKTNAGFKRAALTAFSFNPVSGYTVGLRFFDN